VSGGDCWRNLLFPVPGQQFFDAAGRVIWQARKGVGKPSAWIDVVELAGFDERIDGSGALTATVGTGEGPVVPADGDAAQGPLGGIVRQTDPSVIEEADHRGPALQAVLDRFGDRIFRGELGALGAQPGPELGDERARAVLTDGQAGVGARPLISLSMANSASIRRTGVSEILCLGP
jgi:hypothetical protein